MVEPAALRRHDMVTLDPRAWGDIAAPHLADTPILAEWCARGLPLVHRRRIGTDTAGEIPLGLPLPPSLGKRRLGFTVPRQAILRAEPPPLLSEAADAAPFAWQYTLRRIAAFTPSVRVFGSLAWQHMTGLPYISETSDLDLLWPPPSEPQFFLRTITALAAAAPMRIDGEILLADGSGANWRELALAQDILLKQQDGAILLSHDAFWSRAA